MPSGRWGGRRSGPMGSRLRRATPGLPRAPARGHGLPLHAAKPAWPRSVAQNTMRWPLAAEQPRGALACPRARGVRYGAGSRLLVLVHAVRIPAWPWSCSDRVIRAAPWRATRCRRKSGSDMLLYGLDKFRSLDFNCDFHLSSCLRAVTQTVPQSTLLVLAGRRASTRVARVKAALLC